MKTTIELPDSLPVEARAAAREGGTTLRDLVEQGLREVLALAEGSGSMGRAVAVRPRVLQGRHPSAHLRATDAAGKITGPRVHDARIVAICLAHGVTMLWPADRDLSRFPSLQVTNPLINGG